MSCIITKITGKQKKGRHGNAPPPRDFVATVDYVVNAEGHGDKIHIVDGEEMIFSLNVDGSTLDEWKADILAHHEQFKLDKGKGEPTAHYVVSYEKGKGEVLTAERLKAHVEIKMYHLGYAGHKAICAVHANTEHIHIHIAVDKVAPDKRNGKCYIPINVGTVTQKDKKRNRIIRHDALCQHAAIYDICSSEGWNTEHCLVDSLGQRLKNAKKALPKGVIKEELRTGKQSAQRTIFEILKSHAPPTTHAQAMDLFEVLRGKGISYEIKYTKNNTIKGLVYTFEGKNLGSSYCPLGWEYKNIIPLLQTPEVVPPTVISKHHQYSQPKPQLPPAERVLLYQILENAHKTYKNYDKLREDLAEHSYYLKESGGSFRIVHKDDFDKNYKMSEIARKFSKSKFDAAFDNNLAAELKSAKTSPYAAFENPNDTWKDWQMWRDLQQCQRLQREQQLEQSSPLSPTL